ncbi:acyltransferase [Subsaxibacter sp. CAU 1640]|uniref:acyltransferase family protein n=1 Tax=Subsaxibacter sp. CAU 1640 TaxID=2933271 RepID=UPI002005AC58|nr:acyltransferase [Subsaxibacter sp. CAU 1640]MCK7589853.1 acyltransferase [Subsaxibacter sp. CAU 1640]
MQIDYSKRIFGLDLMRAVAIMMVVCSHILWITPNANGYIPDILSISGVMGVEIFFSLSGFLIGRILFRLYTSQSFSFKNVFYFWIRRWFRTLPNYYLALIANILIAIYIGNQLPDGVWRYFFFLHNFATEMPWLFAESWSLSIEEFAYILGPLLLYGILFIKTSIPRPKLFLAVTLLIIFMFLVSKLIYNHEETIRDMRHWSINVKAIVIYRIDAIYYGVLAAYISIVKPNFWRMMRFPAFFIGVIGLLSLNILIPRHQIFIGTHPQFWNVWYFVIKSISILLTLPLLSTMKSAPKSILIPITYISILSYAMYVLHYSIVMQLMKHFMPTEAFAGLDIAVFIIVYFLLTLSLSYLLYQFYERPLMNLRDKPVIKNHFK